METPNGQQVKMTKLGGPRWRLECGEREIFIEKTDGETTRLEHQNEDEIGTYPDWGMAMRDALRMFDKWEDATKPPPETVYEAAEEAGLQVLLQETLEKMAPLEKKMGELAGMVTIEQLREKMECRDWAVVAQALKFTKSMLRHHDLQQIRLGKKR
jgi:hypothetical protein